MKKIIRWICVVPATFASYVLANIAQSFLAIEWMPVEALEYLQSHPDLGPYPLRGAFYVAVTSLASTIVALYVAQLVAPKDNERRALFLMAGLWTLLGIGGLILLFAQAHPAGVVVRRSLGTVSEFAGIAVAIAMQRASDSER
jgi:hypothetical protein